MVRFIVYITNTKFISTLNLFVVSFQRFIAFYQRLQVLDNVSYSEKFVDNFSATFWKTRIIEVITRSLLDRNYSLNTHFGELS